MGLLNANNCADQLSLAGKYLTPRLLDAEVPSFVAEDGSSSFLDPRFSITKPESIRVGVFTRSVDVYARNVKQWLSNSAVSSNFVRQMQVRRAYG